jgi:hypothetical protein
MQCYTGEPREIGLLNLCRMLRNAAGSGEVMGHNGKHTLSAAGAGAASSATAVGASRVTASARTCNERTASRKTESCKAAIDIVALRLIGNAASRHGCADCTSRLPHVSLHTAAIIFAKCGCNTYFSPLLIPELKSCIVVPGTRGLVQSSGENECGGNVSRWVRKCVTACDM